jgi:uncharacterized protein YbjT (DUF2867 family)
MFAGDDVFLAVILRLPRRTAIYPMFGSGKMRLQPVYADDVAEAVARVVLRTEVGPSTFEFAGPRVYTYADFVRTVAREAGIKPVFIPVSSPFWRGLAWIAEFLPNPPITRNQVDLMQLDNVASPSMPGLRELGITPQPVEVIIHSV